MVKVAVLVVTLALAVQCRYHYTWSVELHPGANAQEVAQQLKMENLGAIGSIPHHYLFRRDSHPRYSDSESIAVTDSLVKHRHIREATQQRVLKRVKRSASEFNFNDEYFPKQWYLFEDYNNVTGAWHLGVTGRGIVVTILDDGLERTHPDLQVNYEPQASTDLNDNDDDPMPRYDITNENKHGTRCAGEVASLADNKVCGVGAAYHSRIGGIRMLDGDVTDAIEAKAIGYNQNFIDIYSASWGPDDDGKTVDGPGSLTVSSFTTGILDGRDGRGSIFVWASGNGGVSYDNCNCDGYTNSIWTLSIGSTSEKGLKPWYAEECSSTLAVTYSSGSGKERQILSTDLHSKCTERHTGTSAAAPLAAGIFALVLQANPLLTWRDMQHLVVKTSKKRNISDGEWVTNGAGYDVSHKFGFGVIDAGGLVELAQLWNNVPAQEICETDIQSKDKSIGTGKVETFEMTSDGCDGKIVFLEHVQCVITIEADKRGDIVLKLKSPSHTLSTLLTSRKYDRSTKGFNKWPFLNVHNWGENPAGTWQLSIQNYGAVKMKLISWQLVFYGTQTIPKLRDTKIPIPNPDNHTDTVCDRHCDSSFGCYGPGPGNCTACADYLQQSTNICVDICGPGEHLDRKGTVCIAHCEVGEYVNEAGQCAGCDPMCEACDGASDTSCTACPERMFLLPSEHTCVDTCPANTITRYGHCDPCHTDCLTCTDVGYDKCLTCQPSLFFHGNRCYQSCPSGYYGESQRGTCIACSAGCTSCFGTEEDQCVGCAESLFLAESKCQDSCPPSYYTTGDNNECKRCHYSCESCSGDSVHQCTGCIDKLFLFSDGQCIKPCPDGYRANSSTRRCDKCPENCATCLDTEDSQCSSCTAHFTLIGSACLPSCGDGQYSASNSSLVCEDCSENCVSCTGADTCTSCSDATFRYNGMCLTTCPASMFKRDRVCVPCDRARSCETCDDRGECLSCKEGYTLSKGQCHNLCGSGQYLVSDGSCHVCSGAKCETCSGAGDLACTACKDSAIQALMTKYNLLGQIYCDGCTSGCELCSKPYNNYCLSCHEGKYLLHDETVDGRAECVESCPAGTYVTQTNDLLECTKCHPSCAKCNGPSSSSCTSCSVGYVLEENSCSTQCSASFYTDGSSCLPCDNVCKSCTSHGPQACLSCPPGSLHQKQSCVRTCSPGYFHLEDSCEPCHATCTECSGASAHQCSKCIPGFTLTEDRCVDSCSQGLYNDQQLNVCKPCHVTCTNCTDEGPAKCLMCKRPLVKNPASRECWQCCSDTVKEYCCYCIGSTTNHCTELVVNYDKKVTTPKHITTGAIVGSAILFGLIAAIAYFLYQWRSKRKPSYTLLNDRDVDDGIGRINDAYRNDLEEDVVAMVT